MKSIKLKKEFPVAAWEGGYTKELFLYPPEGNYQKRDFSFRFSSAVMEKEWGEFTSLPGIRRILMDLEGEMTLHIKDKDPVKLYPDDCICFDGGDDVKSEGIAVDMNLMMKDGVNGKMETIYLLSGEKENNLFYSEENKRSFVLLYLQEGEIQIVQKNGGYLLKTGELAVIEAEDGQDISGYLLENTGKKRARIIKAEVCLEENPDFVC